MKVRHSFILLCFMISASVHAQFRNEEESPKRWFVGGYIGAQFGDITLIDVSPLAGYMITERIAVGLGATYKYYRIRRFYDPILNQTIKYTSHIVGGSTFSRFFITRQIFAHGEYEYLYYKNQTYGAVDFHSIFVGGGYRQYFSANSAVELVLLYNLNEAHNSPYNNPVIRMGVAIGL